MSKDDIYPKYYKDVAYSDETSLNTVNVCIPRPRSSGDNDRLWIVFIHGGAWRDPEIDASSFDATQERLLQSSVADKIACYASINCRLSPYPSHESNPSDPSDPARNAKHPDHINDVLKAILYLQESYHFQDRYVLVGHSCGATLAFQVAMKRYWGSQYESTLALEMNVEPPLAIVGLEGIYDIPALLKYHNEQPVYKDIIHNAFGTMDYEEVSPAYAAFNGSWPDGRLAVLAHSKNDSLVEWEQVERQMRALRHCGWLEGDDAKVLELFELSGDHDEVWQTGEAAKAVEHAVQLLLTM